MPELPNLTLPSPPHWWVSHGGKMEVKRRSNLRLLLKSSTSELELSRDDGSGTFTVFYRLHHGSGSTEHQINGLHETEVKEMFALENGGRSDYQIFAPLTTYADAALPGAYCRQAGYLNIPHPGAGKQGDPNLSVHITEEIRTAVQDFLG